VSTLIADWPYTSNDLLRRLVAKHGAAALNDQIVVPSAQDEQNIDNAPAVSTEPDLRESS